MCILVDVAEGGDYSGTSYWVDYRTEDIDWQSPGDRKISWEKTVERRADAAALAARKDTGSSHQ